MGEGLTDAAALLKHPASSRSSFGAASVLVICAPPGAGRHTFAADWSAGTPPLQVESVGAPTIGEMAAAVAADAPREAEPRRHAVITASREVAAEALRRIPGAVLVGPADLLLTREETAALAASAGYPADELWEWTGGWLGAARRIAVDGEDPIVVARQAGHALTPWFAGSEAWNALAWLVRLPEVSEEILGAVASEAPVSPPPLRLLADLGVCRPAEAEGWFVPGLIRQVVTGSRWLRLADACDVSDEALVGALVRAGRPDVALRMAEHRHAWLGLWSALSERIDLFLAHPAGLARIATRIPRTVRASIDGYATALRLMAAIGRERMNLPLPTREPDYASDEVAQQFRARMQVLRRRPGSRAVAVGLLEQAHLRMTGHHEHAAEAAAELRQIVGDAVSARTVRPGVAALAELQSGISLQIGGQETRAIHAYQAALHEATIVDNRFMMANATANLALLAASSGDPETTGRWLSRHDASVGQVGWGRRMVGRTADLARGHQAFWALDIAGVENVLATLPEHLDTDEFWPVHLWLQIQADVIAADVEGGRLRLERALTERPYAARSALARLYLGHAATLLGMLEGSGPVLAQEFAWPEFRILAATLALRLGEPDQALALLDRVIAETRHARRRRQARYLRGYARAGGRLDLPLRQEFRRSPVPLETTGDLLPLHILGQTDALLEEGLLSPEQARRLSRLPQVPCGEPPRLALTCREQEILALLRQGLSRRTIAGRIHLAENTVKGHLHRLYKKVGASTAAEALAAARRAGY